MVPVVKEPIGLVRQDGKRLDGLTLIPFEGGRSLTWDVTVVCTTGNSYIDLTLQGPGCVAEMAASRKEAKCATLTAIRSRWKLWALSMSRPLLFPYHLGWRISLVSGEDKASVFVSAHFSRHSAFYRCAFARRIVSSDLPDYYMYLLQTLIFFIAFSFFGNIPTEAIVINYNNSRF